MSVPVLGGWFEKAVTPEIQDPRIRFLRPGIHFRLPSKAARSGRTRRKMASLALPFVPGMSTAIARVGRPRHPRPARAGTNCNARTSLIPLKLASKDLEVASSVKSALLVLKGDGPSAPGHVWCSNVDSDDSVRTCCTCTTHELLARHALGGRVAAACAGMSSSTLPPPPWETCNS